MSPPSRARESKFTRGEKCIFIHLVVTFVLILALVLGYFAHLLRATHAGDELRITRRSRAPPARVCGAAWARAGLVRVAARAACGGVLVRARWAVAPGHCVAARARPDLAHVLAAWTLAYRLRDDLYVESEIIRGVVHSHFNGDDFSNNIGLFEQGYSIFMDEYRLPTAGVSDELVRRHEQDAAVVRWDSPGAGMPVGQPVKPLAWQTCRQYLAPVVDLRTNEFCVHAKNDNFSVEHGALVVFGSEVQGFIAWGDKNGNLLLVVLDISFYRDWIDHAISTY